MNAHADPNAAHAVHAPSGAHRWTICTASADAIAMLPPQEETKEAAKGTAAHSEFERCIGSLNGEFVDPATMPIKPVDPDHPSAIGVARAINYVRQLPPGRIWIERRVALTEQIWGKPDLQHWHEETAALTTLDLKDGFVGVDADAEQVWIYDVAGMFTYNLPVRWFRNVICQENDFRPVPRVKQDIQPVEIIYAWATKIAAIPAGPKNFVAGSHCTYCPLFGKCAPTQDLLKELATVIAMADEARPEQVALFMALKKPIEDWFKSFEKANMKKALKGTKFPGMKLVETRPHKAWRDPAEARALVMERLGPDALDVPTPAQAIDRGIPADVVDAIAPRPDGGPALAFESDKRKDWKPKSVDSMFAKLVQKG